MGFLEQENTRDRVCLLIFRKAFVGGERGGFKISLVESRSGSSGRAGRSGAGRSGAARSGGGWLRELGAGGSLRGGRVAPGEGRSGSSGRAGRSGTGPSGADRSGGRLLRGRVAPEAGRSESSGQAGRSGAGRCGGGSLRELGAGGSLRGRVDVSLAQMMMLLYRWDVNVIVLFALTLSFPLGTHIVGQAEPACQIAHTIFREWRLHGCAKLGSSCRIEQSKTSGSCATAILQ